MLILERSVFVSGGVDGEGRNLVLAVRGVWVFVADLCRFRWCSDVFCGKRQVVFLEPRM